MNSDEMSIDFENALVPWIGKTIKLADYLLLELLRQNDERLTKEQVIVLKRLNDNDGMNQNELAFITLRNKSSLTRLLSNMEKSGYIHRKQSSIDKRNKHVYLTNKGKVTFKRIKPILKNFFTTVEKGFSKEDKEHLIEALKKIQFNLNSKIESI